METDGAVFLDTIIERGGAPIVQEEDHGHCLPEVVQLKSSSPNPGHDGGIGNGLNGDRKLARSKDEVGMCSSSIVEMSAR